MRMGWVEGFYGLPFSPNTRIQIIRYLGMKTNSFYTYAPKGDAFFRKKWREKIPDEHLTYLKSLAQEAKNHQVNFGIGISPYEIYLNWDAETQDHLARRIFELEEIGIRSLSVLFDDMRGDFLELASSQAKIMNWIVENSHFERYALCPTYYSNDPVLDRIFGERPKDYLKELGALLNPKVNCYWTGESICSESYAVEEIEKVTQTMRRPLILWDNYPVNDGEKMCRHLHLKPFQNRPAALRGLLQDHAINPMNQGALSLLVTETLYASYRDGSEYRPQEAWRTAACEFLGLELAQKLEEDVALFTETGLEEMNDGQKIGRLKTYSQFVNDSNPRIAMAAQEIVDWLNGRYRVTRDLVLTQ